MSLTQQAKNLLTWNSANLVHDANFSKINLAELFAEQFQVIANGRTYEANYDNYYDFLQNFRATIKSISYDVYEYIESDQRVTIPMDAHITRVDGKRENFAAILILKFDANNKIILWHEVYHLIEKQEI